MCMRATLLSQLPGTQTYVSRAIQPTSGSEREASSAEGIPQNLEVATDLNVPQKTRELVGLVHKC